jgi:hypothetical protein
MVNRTVSFGTGGTDRGTYFSGPNSKESYIQFDAGSFPTALNINSNGVPVFHLNSVSITSGSNFTRYTIDGNAVITAWFGPNKKATFQGRTGNGNHVYNSWDNAYYYRNQSITAANAIGTAGSYTWSTVPTSVQNLSIGRTNNGTTLTGSFSGPADNGNSGVDYYRVFTSENGAEWVTQGDGYQSGQISLSATSTSNYRILVYAHNARGFSVGSTSAYSYGVPSKPSRPSATPDPAIAGRIRVSWSAPSSSLTILEYAVDRYSANGQTYLERIYSGGTALSVNDSGRPRGEEYTYRFYARNSTGWSEISDASGKVMAPGLPSAPSSIIGPSQTPSLKVGRNVTINITRDSNGFGNNITGYFLQFSTDNGATWHGWNNTTKTRINNGENEVTGTSFTYQLLTPALTYLWRVYAKNSVGTGDLTRVTPVGVFVSAGGRRWTGSTWTPTESAKRWTGSAWVDITVAKRWSGTAWVDLT